MKRIFKLLITMVVLTLLISTCKDKNSGISTFTTHVDLSTSSIAADENATSMLFSADNGAHFAEFADLPIGTKFQAKVIDNATGKFVDDANFFSLDWSGSNPKPSDAKADAPEFTVADNTHILVKVVDKHCTFDPTSFTGTWSSTGGVIVLVRNLNT